ncbi:MAG: hypothetical protein P1U63_00170 [Coxiellaceae bacterium]|nr:hypothetical protein [Coxiellaceae bacterium]
MMPELDLAIADALQCYQNLVTRADRLTQKILQTQQSVDALKQFTTIAEQYQTTPHCTAAQWIIQLRHDLDLLPPVARRLNNEASDDMVDMSGLRAERTLPHQANRDEDNEQLEKQYQQHQASCQLMEQHCDQSHHYLQLLRYQVEQMREAVSVLLSQVIADPVQVETIVVLQEKLLKAQLAIS